VMSGDIVPLEAEPRFPARDQSPPLRGVTSRTLSSRLSVFKMAVNALHNTYASDMPPPDTLTRKRIAGRVGTQARARGATGR
jgi:hypothetical protein